MPEIRTNNEWIEFSVKRLNQFMKAYTTEGDVPHEYVYNEKANSVVGKHMFKHGEQVLFSFDDIQVFITYLRGYCQGKRAGFFLLPKI